MKFNILFTCLIVFSCFAKGQILIEDFESSSAQSGLFPNGWTTSNNEWTINDPSTGTPGGNGSTTIVEPTNTSQLSGNCSNVYAIVDSDGFGSGNSQSTDLISPIIDLSAFSGGITLSFNHSFRVFGTPVAKIETSIDSGQTWSLLHSYPNVSSYGPQFYDISSLAGHKNVQIRFHYEGNYDWWWAIDDIIIKQSPSKDISLTSLNIPSIKGPGITTIKGSVTNLGVDTINYFDIIWDNGNGAQSGTFNVSLAYGESYDFEHLISMQASPLQQYNIVVKAVFQGDEDTTNNALVHNLDIGAFNPFKKVLFEDQTIGANNFGFWSPRGIVRMEELMLSNSSDSLEIISIHGNAGTGTSDAMYYSMYQDSCFNNNYVSANAWPQSLIDRKTVKGLETAIGSSINHFNEFKNDFGYANIDVIPSYDTISRELMVETDLKFAINMANLNLALVITEDSVHDPDDMGYSQFNAYNGGGNGPLASIGVDFTTAGNPVPPNMMYFRNVARKIIPSFSGSSTALPSPVLADSSYNYTFATYSIPNEYDPSKLRAIVLLIDPTNGFVYNSNGANVNGPKKIGVNETPLPFKLNVYPNPCSEKLYYHIEKAGDTKVTLIDIKGTIVYSHNVLANAESNNYSIDVSSYARGMYLLRLETENTQFSKKIVLD